MLYNEKKDLEIFKVEAVKGVRFFNAIFTTFAYYFYLSIIPIIRIGFGDRSIEVTNVLMSVAVMFAIGNIFDSYGAYLHLMAYLIAVGFHYLDALKRARQGKLWYSRSMGISYLAINPNTSPNLADKIHRYGEPLMLIGAGGIVSAFGGVIYGLFLAGCGLGVAVVEAYLHNELWNKVRDQIDAQIIAEFYAEEVRIATQTRNGDYSESVKSNDKGVRTVGFGNSPTALEYFNKRRKEQEKRNRDNKRNRNRNQNEEEEEEVD